MSEITLLPKVPYRGIHAFRYVDAPIFFGREDDINKLIRTITIYRGVLLYGESGVGKSSLINAGLIPKAHEEGFLSERIRVQPRVDEELIIERISNNIDSQTSYLPSLIAHENETLPRLVLSIGNFKNRLIDLSKEVTEKYPLLIFDQFEEFITLFEEASLNKELTNKALQIQKELLTLIVDLILDSSYKVKLVFSFREDYLAKLEKLFVQCPELMNQYVRLTPLRLKELHKIVHGPFEKFPGHFLPELSPELINNVIKAVEERSETDFLNLTVVQVACLKLWSSPSPKDEFAQKGIQGLLEAYLSEAMDNLPDDQRNLAVLLLVKLVTPAGTRNVVSEADLYDAVTERQKVPVDNIENTLNSLEQQAKLIRREYRNGTYFYEIVSEFLVPWIRERRNEILKKEALEEFEQQQIAKRNENEQKKRVTRAYTIAGISILFALIAASVLVIIMNLNKKVNAQAKKLQVQTIKLKEQNNDLQKYVQLINARQKAQEEIIENAQNLTDSLKSFIVSSDNKVNRNDIRKNNAEQDKVEQKQTKILNSFSNKVRNSTYLTTVVAYNINNDLYIDVNNFLKQKGYSVNEVNWNFTSDDFSNNWPDWVAKQSSIFYYDNKSKNKALQLSRDLEKFTNFKFLVTRGAGLGVLAGQEEFTFYIHIINN